MMDSNPSHNLFQLAAACVFAAVGAIVGWNQAPDAEWRAAAAGAGVGMVAAVFLTGAVLAFFQPPPTMRTLTRSQYHAFHRRIRGALVLYVAMSLVGLSLLWIQQVAGNGPASMTIIICLFGFLVVPYAAGMYTTFRLSRVKCPGCQRDFGLHSPFDVDSHTCQHCGALFQEESRAE